PVRAGDVFGGQLRRRHLVEQRLELVVVVPVDQGDVDAFLTQAVGTRDTGQTAAHDDERPPPRLSRHSESSSRTSARMIRPAAWISARCENACGKLPRWRARSTSNSSAYSPRGEAIRSSRSMRLLARSIWPTTASADTSQNE